MRLAPISPDGEMGPAQTMGCLVCVYLSGALAAANERTGARFWPGTSIKRWPQAPSGRRRRRRGRWRRQRSSGARNRRPSKLTTAPQSAADSRGRLELPKSIKTGRENRLAAETAAAWQAFCGFASGSVRWKRGQGQDHRQSWRRVSNVPRAAARPGPKSQPGRLHRDNQHTFAASLGLIIVAELREPPRGRRPRPAAVAPSETGTQRRLRYTRAIVPTAKPSHDQHHRWRHQIAFVTPE